MVKADLVNSLTVLHTQVVIIPLYISLDIYLRNLVVPYSYR